MIAREVWRQPLRATPLDNVIDVHVAHLRRKLEAGPDSRLLHTVRGLGLLLSEREP
jgi:two-component system copper resistance phosphate regulon response regulator CusR